MNRRKLLKIGGILRNTKFDRYLLDDLRNLLRFARGRYKRDISRDMPYPPTVSLELTNRCNLHCLMCPREHDFGKELVMGEMDTALAKRIIDEIIPYQHSMGLTGMGETLFASNLVEVARYIKEKKKSVVIFISSNANFPNFLEKVSEVLPYIDTVQISTDGVGEGYERIRRNASFKLLDRNLDGLMPVARRHNVDVMFNMVVSKQNYEQMPAVLEYALAKGVRYVNYNYVNLASLSDVPAGDYYKFFEGEEFRKKLEQAKEFAARHSGSLYVTGLDYPGNPGIRKCGLMWNHTQINVNGEVPPCCAKPFSRQYSFGNVKHDSVINVLNSDKAKSFKKHYAEGTVHPFCSNCVFVNL